ncbi:MAG: hypothetical protein ACI30O_07785 [Muribaculaceae bacterium]
MSNSNNQNAGDALVNGIGAIFEGIGSIFVGAVQVVCGVVDAAFEIIKCAVEVAVWIVAGIFTIAGDLLKYVGETLTKAFTPETVVVVPPKKLPSLVRFMHAEAEKNGISEDPEYLEIKRKVDDAVENKEAMVYTVGTDSEGEVAVANPQMVKAEGYDAKIVEAENKGQIYTKKVRVAS